jgi:hypothetical protein
MRIHMVVQASPVQAQTKGYVSPKKLFERNSVQSFRLITTMICAFREKIPEFEGREVLNSEGT